MNCQRCQSTKIMSIQAKCSDLFCGFDHNIGVEFDGYVPEKIGIGGGDYIQFDYCRTCGQIQGEFPCV